MGNIFGGPKTKSGPSESEKMMQMMMMQQMQQQNMLNIAAVQANSGEAEKKALEKRRALAGKGMEGTILGGSEGDDSELLRKKLLGG